MTTINTESMVAQKDLIKEEFPNRLISFDTLQKRTAKNHFYYEFTWRVYDEDCDY
jgi:hypothetical protein